MTQKGAWRTYNKNDSTCIRLAKEDDSFNIPQEYCKTINGEIWYGGFYSQKEMKELINYAENRFITIVPEIDVPGHFTSAIENYPYLSCTGEAGWGTLFSYPACLGKESTYKFIENVLSEVIDLFPSEYIHIGGDEVNMQSWKKCQLCQAEIKRLGLKDEHELQSHFNCQIEKFLQSKGKKLLGWDEIVQGGLSESATVMWWRNWANTAPYLAANAGNDIVISTCFELYFNGDYSFTPLNKVYNFNPVPVDFSAEQAQYILGAQACLWGETIPSLKRLQFQAFPRITALSEIAWTPNNLKDWDSFNIRVKNEFNRWDIMNVFYHMPPITGIADKWVFTDSTVIDLNIPIPDMQVYYTLDGSTPNKFSNLYSAPVLIKEPCKLRARVYRKHLFSEIFESEFEKQTYREPIELQQPKQGIQRFYCKGKFESARDVNSANSRTSSIVEEIGLGEYAGEKFFGLVFTGFIYIPETGIYTFYTTSDDGDVLYIGDEIVVDNDGSHESRERLGMIALKAGFHPVTIKFRQFENYIDLKVAVKGPGYEKRPIQLNDLFLGEVKE